MVLIRQSYLFILQQKTPEINSGVSNFEGKD
jgi:hypothetical protein